MYFSKKRDIIQLFIDWKSRKNRKPLIVRGAHQIGVKTGIRFNTDTPSIGEFKTKVRTVATNAEINIQLLSLPLYMINQLSRLIDEL